MATYTLQMTEIEEKLEVEDQGPIHNKYSSEKNTTMLRFPSQWRKLGPSIFGYLLEPMTTSSRKDTSWMDGLRGLSSIVVFNFHFLMMYSDISTVGFGHDRSHLQVLRIPPLNLLHDGATCVNIFFVISGYVCSARSLQMMGHNRDDELLRCLSSSVFRRFFRLYLPVICIMLITATMAYTGMLELLRPMMDDKKHFFPGPYGEVQLERFPTLRAQLAFFWQELMQVINVFNLGPAHLKHDPHLWSIGYEFRGTMHLYIALLGLSRCKPKTRLSWLCALAAIYLYWDRWEGPLFFLGAAIAQYRLLRGPNVTSLSPVENGYFVKLLHTKANVTPSTKRTKSSSLTFQRLFRLVCYIFALWLMAYPIKAHKFESPGFTWITSLIPAWYRRKEKLPKSIGVLILIQLLSTTPRPSSSYWHHVLTLKPAQYLGQNMFSLYLVHGPILHLVGYGIPHWTWAVIGKSNAFTHAMGLTVGWFVSLVLCLSAAHVFALVVESRCVRAVQWIEKKCLEDR